MLSQSNAPLMPASISMQILCPPEKTFSDLVNNNGHYLCWNFTASPVVRKYTHTDFRNRRCSHISSSDIASARLCYAGSLIRISDARSFQFQHPNRSFFAVRSQSDVGLVDAEQSGNGSAGSRISRVSRAEAQKALSEYLHGTRSLWFTDAEHISKNSPVFLQDLLARIEGDHDAGRRLTRFFRYHPINEFEPFFESLGLKPFEIHPLLPRDLMFLSDDELLLENYHILCNYGVPRSKIGKMYKEGTELFSYSYGLLRSKLQAYEKLGLSKSTVIKLVSCCPTLLVGDVNAEFHQVLEKLRSLGVELDCIRGCLSDKSAYSWDRILEMLSFLDVMGCDENELAALIKTNPRFIFDGSGKKIYILVAVLLKLGLGMNKILALFVQYPRILLGNFTKNLLQSVHFLVDIGMTTDDITKILSSHVRVLGSCSCDDPDVILEGLNMSAKRLCEIIMEDPSRFCTLAAVRGRSGPIILPKVEGIFLQEKTNFLLKVGFVENTDEMAKALRKFRGRGDQLEERFNCLLNAGLNSDTASGMIKSVPHILNQSADVIQKKIDYLLNHLGYPLQALVAYPSFLCCSMEKIKLRFSMVSWLKERGRVIACKKIKTVNSDLALSTILSCSDQRFEKYFVNVHPDGPDEWERLKGSVSLR